MERDRQRQVGLRTERQPGLQIETVTQKEHSEA